MYCTFIILRERKESNLKRICIKCNKEKELNNDNFSKRKRDKFGFDKTCKECKREYDRKRYQAKKEELKSKSKEYYRKNKQKRIDYQLEYYNKNKDYYSNAEKEWRKKNPIQRRIINGRNRSKDSNSKTLNKDEWIATINYFDNKCAYCGMTIDEHKERYGQVLNQDHLIPLSRGGSYSMNNIVPVCKSCNSKKSNKTFDEWYKNSDVYNPLREIRVHKFVKEFKDGI